MESVRVLIIFKFVGYVPNNNLHLQFHDSILTNKSKQALLIVISSLFLVSYTYRLSAYFPPGAIKMYFWDTNYTSTTLRYPLQGVTPH